MLPPGRLPTIKGPPLSVWKKALDVQLFQRGLMRFYTVRIVSRTWRLFPNKILLFYKLQQTRIVTTITGRQRSKFKSQDKKGDSHDRLNRNAAQSYDDSRTPPQRQLYYPGYERLNTRRIDPRKSFNEVEDTCQMDRERIRKYRDKTYRVGNHARIRGTLLPPAIITLYRASIFRQQIFPRFSSRVPLPSFLFCGRRIWFRWPSSPAFRC